MSSTTGSRHNCEQGQGYSPQQQRNHRGGGERHHHRPHPTGGAGGIPWGGGEGGCGSPASYIPQSPGGLIIKALHYSRVSAAGRPGWDAGNGKTATRLQGAL